MSSLFRTSKLESPRSALQVEVVLGDGVFPPRPRSPHRRSTLKKRIDRSWRSRHGTGGAAPLASRYRWMPRLTVSYVKARVFWSAVWAPVVIGAPGGDWFGARSRSSLDPFVPIYPTERMTLRTNLIFDREVPGLRVRGAEVRDPRRRYWSEYSALISGSRFQASAPASES